MKSPGFCLFLIVCLLCATVGRADPSRVVVVANGNVPESVELARYYLQARSIPGHHLCILDLPTGEQMSRHDYNTRLRDPLLAFLRESDLIRQEPRPPNEVEFHETAWITTEAQVDYLVLMYGVPLRVGDTRFRLATRITDRLGHPRFKNMASVDSECALLLAQPYDIAGPYINPLYRELVFSRQVDENQYLLVAARLDAPDPETVRRMIDDALFAERYGLQGRMYFDARGLQGGPYYIGDYWIREAHDRFARAGYETALNLEEALWPEGYPLEDAALYFGWYAEHVEGPFLREDFRFARGAVAYHIHSASATSLRRNDRYWAGPLLAKGAAATMGAVSEPFLTYTPDLKILAERLTHGYSFGEAAHLATRVLSWQVTVVGDPLYRPFGKSLADQMAHLTEDNRPEIEWAHVRYANLLIQQGRFNPALQYLRARLQEGGQFVLREQLGDLYALNDLVQEAGLYYGQVIQGTDSAVTAGRVAAKWIRILLRLNQQEQADRLVSALQTKWGSEHPVMIWLSEQRGVPHVD